MFIQKLLTDPAYFLIAVGIVIFSITIHEFCHALAATWEGDDTPARAGRLTLNPIVHMGVYSLVFLAVAGIAWGATPVNRARFRHGAIGNALVSFAGPFSNLLLLFGFSVGIVLMASGTSQAAEPPLWLAIFSVGAYLNAFLFLLNMLPIPPLDGYEILETFLPALRPYATALNQYGFVILLVLFFMFNLGSWLSGIASEMVLMTLSAARNLL